MGNVMGCCQTNAAKGGHGKRTLDGVDDEAEPEVWPRSSDPSTWTERTPHAFDIRSTACGTLSSRAAVHFDWGRWLQVMDAPKKEITPENLLLAAALSGDTSTVQTLLASGVSVNSKGDKVSALLASPLATHEAGVPRSAS